MKADARRPRHERRTARALHAQIKAAGDDGGYSSTALSAHLGFAEGGQSSYALDGKEQKIDVSRVDVSKNGIELQDREFFAAMREGRESNACARQLRHCYDVLHDPERQLASG